MMSEFVTIFNKDTSVVGEIPEEELAMTFPFPLDAFQREGIYRIYKKENVFITAHTGSGKTVLALYAIAECFRLNKRVIYTSPTKSLSNQKYAEFVDKFGGKDKIGILTGDIKMNPDAPCLIMTTEILRNVLYRDASKEKEKDGITDNTRVSLRVEDIGAVVFDEVHYVNDPERGKVWEEVFILLPREVTLVLLSATIDRPQDFAGWLGDLKKSPIHLIPTSHRVVPLRHYYWNPDRPNADMIELLMEDGRFKNYDVVNTKYKRHDINRIMNPLIERLMNDNLLPVLFFTFSRKRCEKLCKSVNGISLLDHNEEASVRNLFNFYMHPYKNIYENIPQYQEIYNLMRRGIAYHHSGLIPILKEIVEIIFGRGLIKVLFATETFAVGVNMPTKTVIFTELEKFDNSGRRYLRTDEYLQMSGRAGRRGLDKVGTVILVPAMVWPDRDILKNMMTGKSPSINSRFVPTYQFILKTMMSSQEETKTDLFLDKTYRSLQDKKERDNLLINMEGLREELRKIEEDNAEMFASNFVEKMQMYDKNRKRLEDRFMVLKGKDRKRVEDEQRKIESEYGNFGKLKEKWMEYEEIRKELEEMNSDYEYFETYLGITSEKMRRMLVELEYITEENEIKEKGITAMNIGEVDELMLTEMIHRDMLEGLSIEEIITVLAMFIDEIDKTQEERYIQDLDIPSSVSRIYREINEIGEELIRMEDRLDIRIHGDDYYTGGILKMDMLEPTWIWVNGGTMTELYNTTELYEGNFCRGMLRLNQLCDTVYGICMNLGKLEVANRMEGYKERLIRDFTTVSSLYVR